MTFGGNRAPTAGKDTTLHSPLLMSKRQSNKAKHNNSQGPDKQNIRHLKHIGPPGLAFLTSMFKTALIKNIIHHTWKLDNIVHITKTQTRAPHTGPYPSTQ